MLYLYPYPHPGIFTFTRVYPYPGYCATGVQHLKELRVRAIPRVWFGTYPTEHNIFTYRSSGTGNTSGMARYVPHRTQPFYLQKFRVRVWKSYRTHRTRALTRAFLTAYTYLGYCATGVQNLQQVRDTGVNVVQKLRKFRYRQYPGKYPGCVWFCTYPTEHNLGNSLI